MEQITNTTGGTVEMGIGVNLPSITERYRRKKRILEEDLSQVNKALDLLEKNPDLQELLDAVSRVRFY